MNCGTGEFGHIDPALVDCLLPLAGRNHSAYQFGGAPLGQIRPLHYDSRHVQVSWPAV